MGGFRPGNGLRRKRACDLARTWHRIHLCRYRPAGNDLLIGSEAPQAAITITRWPDFLRQFATAPPLYRECTEDAYAMPRGAAVAGGADTVRSKMQKASPNARRGLIAFVRQQAMQTLGVTDEINVGRPPRELGLDSFMSVTLVNRLKTALGIRISAVKLIQGPSIEQIVHDICRAWATRKSSLRGSRCRAQGTRRAAGSSSPMRNRSRARGCSAFPSLAAARPSITTGPRRLTLPSRSSRSSPRSAGRIEESRSISGNSPPRWSGKCAFCSIDPSLSSGIVSEA